MTTNEKLTKARMSLLLNEPFFASLLLRLKFVRNDNIPTACVDGKTLTYSGKYVDGLTVPELTTVLAHEVLHCALGHFARRGARDLKDWNYATDYAINESLQEINEKAQASSKAPPFPFPQGALLNKQHRGKSAEEIYSARKTQQQPPQQSQGAGGQSNPQQSQSPQQSQGKGQGAGKGQGKPQPGNGQGDEPSDDTGAGMGDVTDEPPESDGGADDAELAEDWKQAAVQAAALAKGRGSLPSELARLVDSLVNPKKNWREVLADLIRQTAKDDYNFLRPNPRFLGTGFCLPSLHSQRLGEIAIAVDTSGSIFPSLLQEFLSEMEAIAHETKPEKILLMDCDAQVHSLREFEPYDDLPKDMRGGGGTSFVPPIEVLDEQNRIPVCLIYFTDLDGTFPKEAPAYPVIWVAPKERYGTRVPPFGTLIELD